MSPSNQPESCGGQVLLPPADLSVLSILKNARTDDNWQCSVDARAILPLLSIPAAIVDVSTVAACCNDKFARKFEKMSLASQMSLDAAFTQFAYSQSITVTLPLEHDESDMLAPLDWLQMARIGKSPTTILLQLLTLHDDCQPAVPEFATAPPPLPLSGQDVLDLVSAQQRQLGQELHDRVGQELTGLSLLAFELTDRLKHSDTAEAKLARKLTEGLDHTFKSVQTIARGIFPTEIDDSNFALALESLADEVDQCPHVRCTSDCPHDDFVTSPGTATHLYRIAQEAVSNAVRHGKAEHIHLSLHIANSLLIMRIEDDGVGMATVRSGEGLGLKIMHYRAALVGAHLQFIPRNPHGLIVLCSLVLEKRSCDNYPSPATIPLTS